MIVIRYLLALLVGLGLDLVVLADTRQEVLVTAGAANLVQSNLKMSC